jgi:hypothetical protein
MKLKNLLQANLQLKCNFKFDPICFVLRLYQKTHVNWD